MACFYRKTLQMRQSVCARRKQSSLKPAKYIFRSILIHMEFNSATRRLPWIRFIHRLKSLNTLQAKKTTTAHGKVRWKFFQPFMDFLYPHISTLIDWQQPVEFLDKELQKITRKSKNSRRYADKLVKVHFLNGSEKWILIHIEVQGAPEVDFAERMFIYYYRIRDRYQKPVISLAVLTGTQPSFRPKHYSDTIAGCSIRFEFETVKLLDW